MAEIISIGERGLAVCFSKHDLINMKSGKTIHGELVNASGKTAIMFMRDQTFRQMQQKFSKVVDVASSRLAVADDQGEVEGLAGDLAASSVEGEL